MDAGGSSAILYSGLEGIFLHKSAVINLSNNIFQVNSISHSF